MYQIPQARALGSVETGQIRLGVMGPTGTGKSFSICTTFPNVVVGDIDNNLVGIKKLKPEIQVIPFYDPQWIRDNKYPNIRDAVLMWIRTEGLKLESDQTFFLDGWTQLQDAFDQQTSSEPQVTKGGKIDEFAFWDKKIDYSRDILVALRSLKCHVAVSFHEQETRNQNGQLLSKIEPLMQGKFVKKISLYFTDFFRCIAEKKFDKSTPPKVIGADFYWQTRTDGDVGLKTRMRSDTPMLIKPSYESFSEYK